MSRQTRFALGLIVCVLAAVLMIAGWVNIAWGSAIGVIGIGLLASSAPRGADS